MKNYGHLTLSVLRSILALFVGLMLISLVVEAIEFAVVTALHGSVTTDTAVYFEIRNRLPVIILKLIYNTLAALLGGYVAAWIAGRRETQHGLLLMLIQAIALIWGMTASPFASSTPLWLWIALLILTSAAIVAGAWIRGKRKRRTLTVQQS